MNLGQLLTCTIACGISLAAGIGTARGHGSAPVVVSAAGGKLLTNQYVYAETDPELTYSPLNFDQFTNVPGFTIQGSAAGQIHFEVNSPLWFSDGGAAEPADTESLGLFTNIDDDPPVGVTVTGQGPTNQGAYPLRAAGVLLNQHLHYLSYEFSPGNERTGAYGIYMKLSSPSHLDSQRFLVVFNRGLTETATFNSAVMAIRSQLPGDMDDDGDVDNFDIQPFELALTDPAAYIAQYPSLGPLASPSLLPEAFRRRGDIDGDGDFDNFDIQPFEDLLTSSSAVPQAAVPEPSSLVLLSGGLAMLLLGYPRMQRAHLSREVD